MKLKETGGLLVAILALAAVAAVVTVILRLELAMLYTLMLILVGGIAFAIACVGVAFALRAWRSTGPQEIQRIIERHTIERDGRMPAQPKIHLLESKSGQPAMYPELLRAAYASGARSLSDGTDGTEIVEAETEELDGQWRVWPGTCKE